MTVDLPGAMSEIDRREGQGSGHLESEELIRSRWVSSGVRTPASQNSEPERLSGNSKAPGVPFVAPLPEDYLFRLVYQRMSGRFRHQNSHRRLRTMPKVTFVKEKKTIDVPEGANLRTAARKAGVELYKGVHKYLNCQGFGLCGSCRVYVKEGKTNVSKPGLVENFTTKLGGNPEAFFAYVGHEDEMRLACQCKVEGDIKVETKAPCNFHGEKFWG